MKLLANHKHVIYSVISLPVAFLLLSFSYDIFEQNNFLNISYPGLYLSPFVGTILFLLCSVVNYSNYRAIRRRESSKISKLIIAIIFAISLLLAIIFLIFSVSNFPALIK